jgi:5-methylcytosine-specific restriction protein A
MNAIEELKPTSRPNVIDLAAAAGVDVTPWSFGKDGRPFLRPSQNPKFCYEWALVEPGRVLVLNLWTKNLQVAESGRAFEVLNYRKVATDVAKSKTVSASHRGTITSRAKRADNAVRLALAEGLPVRAIINAGDPRQAADPADVKSHVTLRMLDHVRWVIAGYGDRSGDITVVRGTQPSHSVSETHGVDQHSLDAKKHPAKSERTRLEYERQREIRDRALDRSKGCCELCGARGFLTASGRFYLETHHIVPLAEGGLDDPGNVAALCPTDHRRAHYARNRAAIRTALQAMITVKLTPATPVAVRVKRSAS